MVMSAVPHPMSSRRAPGASGENRAWSHRAGSCRLSHCSGTKSCPPRKPPALRRHFYLFTFFDKKGNADLKTGLQRGWLGHAAARRGAPHTRVRGGNLQLHERWQGHANGSRVVLEQLDEGAPDQEVQRVADHFVGKGVGLIAFLVKEVRTTAVAIQIGGRNQLEIRLPELVTRLECLLKDRVGEKVSNLQAHQGLAAPGGGRVHLRFQAGERSVVHLKQSPSLDVNRINQYGHVLLNGRSAPRASPRSQCPRNSRLPGNLFRARLRWRCACLTVLGGGGPRYAANPGLTPIFGAVCRKWAVCPRVCPTRTRCALVCPPQRLSTLAMCVAIAPNHLRFRRFRPISFCGVV